MSDINWSSPMLYKQDEHSGLRQWRTWSRGEKVHVEFGKVHGKLQTTFDVVEGKNSGKINGTTPYEQAALKAKQLYRKRVKMGFMPDAAVAKKIKNSLPAFLPMLAHVFEDVKDPIFPAFIQPKLDGVRCLAVVEKGEATLYTRSQKIIGTVPHVNAAVEDIARRTGVREFKLDGELYRHSLNDDFGQILGLVKRGTTSEHSHLIQYHVYDTAEENTPFHMRATDLKIIADALDSKQDVIKVVETREVVDKAAMYHTMQKFLIIDKYEGAMYRAREGYYEGKRSRNLLKVKVMRDAEFRVTGCHPGTGKLRGKVGSFICKLENGAEFKAKLEGDLDNLPTLEEGPMYIGKLLTVRFQNYSPDGVPRFPVGVRFKDLEVEA